MQWQGLGIHLERDAFLRRSVHDVIHRRPWLVALQGLGERLSHSLERFVEIGIGRNLCRPLVKGGDVVLVGGVDGEDSLAHPDSTQRRGMVGGGRDFGGLFHTSHRDCDVVSEVKDGVVVSDQQVGWAGESVEQGAAHQFTKQKGPQCLSVQKFLRVSRPNGTGALEFQRTTVAVGDQQASDERAVISFQRGQETESKCAGIYGRFAHRVGFRGAGTRVGVLVPT